VLSFILDMKGKKPNNLRDTSSRLIVYDGSSAYSALY